MVTHDLVTIPIRKQIYLDILVSTVTPICAEISFTSSRSEMVCSPACAGWYILQQLHISKTRSCAEHPFLILEPRWKIYSWTYQQHESSKSDVRDCACHTQRKYMRVSGTVGVKPFTTHIWDETYSLLIYKGAEHPKQVLFILMLIISFFHYKPVVCCVEWLEVDVVHPINHRKDWFPQKPNHRFPCLYHPSVLLCEAILKAQKFFYNIFLHIYFNAK